jgi:hypothetical protein
MAAMTSRENQELITRLRLKLRISLVHKLTELYIYQFIKYSLLTLFENSVKNERAKAMMNRTNIKENLVNV